MNNMPSFLGSLHPSDAVPDETFEPDPMEAGPG